MQNGPKIRRPPHHRPAAFGGQSKSIATRPLHPPSPNAQRNYERYLALARAEAQAGNPVGAENYYQHAEHYFRLLSSTRERTNGPDQSGQGR
jgi:hypothetical protein